MFIFFDIETTDKDPKICDFKCAVAIDSSKKELIFSNAKKFAMYLAHTDNADATFVTFNGLNFDFQVMSRFAPNDFVKQKIQDIAINRHIDIMYGFLIEHGYPASMQSFALELGLSKTWNGEEAAQPDADIEKVKEYCKEDVIVLSKVFFIGLENGLLKRKSKAGKKLTWVLPEGNFPTVQDCIEQWKQSPADQSWMTTPLDVEGIKSWTSA